MGQHIYRNAILAEFLVRGLIREKGGLRLPVKGEATSEEVDQISTIPFSFRLYSYHIPNSHTNVIGPVQIATKFQYPPVYQMLGSDDWLCQLSHMHELKEVLDSQGVSNMAITLDGRQHGWDTRLEIWDEDDVEYIAPAVEWLHSKIDG